MFVSAWPSTLVSRPSTVFALSVAVAIWYLLMGRWTPLEEIDERLALKVGKIITSVGLKGLKQLGQTRLALRKETYRLLTAGRIYALNPIKNSHRPAEAQKKKALLMKKNLSNHIPVLCG